MSALDNITARAQTPDQLIPYVQAVSGMTSQALGELVLHRFENSGVLAAFSPRDPNDASAMNDAVDLALALDDLEDLTVLGPAAPIKAPQSVQPGKDVYWGFALEKIKKSPKLKNTLKRAAGETEIEQSGGPGSWTSAHAALCEDFCRRKKGVLSEDAVFLFKQIGKYLGGAPEARLFSARDRRGKLKACAIGDFSAFANAFYMFAFRYSDAAPGSADLLLDAITAEAQSRGYETLNLGLGINSGVEFFKKKWGAEPLFPYVECRWKIKKKSWLSRLLGRK